MASGRPPRHWYAQWLQALTTIHAAVDVRLPAVLHRTERLGRDLEALGIQVPENQAAIAYTQALNTEAQNMGAAYVLTGAHLMGGEIMRRRLDGFPTKHLEWDDRKEALAELALLRQRQDIVQPARDCFAALLAVMDEIHSREPEGQGELLWNKNL